LEKLDPEQLALGLEDLEQAVAAAEAEAEKNDPTLRRGSSSTKPGHRCRPRAGPNRHHQIKNGVNLVARHILLNTIGIFIVTRQRTTRDHRPQLDEPEIQHCISGGYAKHGACSDIRQGHHPAPP
jgi:hypothetical protein